LDGLLFDLAVKAIFKTLTTGNYANVGVFTGGVVENKIRNHAEHMARRLGANQPRKETTEHASAQRPKE
jgi:hypothetical protein